MTTPPAVTWREMWRITLSLAVTCVIAGSVLGLCFTLTEPTIQSHHLEEEARMVRQLLDLDATASIVQVRRYVEEGTSPRVGYLLPDGYHRYDLEGRPVDATARPETLATASVADLDQWIALTFPGTHAVGRFFAGYHADGALAGYVTEASQYGFKSHIRFFVALTPALAIRGVEVIAHEEDPGLGAEMTKPFFKHQFAGRSRESLARLAVTKDPLPSARRAVVVAREGIPYAAWQAAYGAALGALDRQPIYAVTGATISSRALTDGVKQAVAHLHHRLQVVHMTAIGGAHVPFGSACGYFLVHPASLGPRTRSSPLTPQRAKPLEPPPQRRCAAGPWGPTEVSDE
ncbi:MAG: FMN-binding protein [Deltaproteobacteria bacterium]|nr:FMN-binding protein [Deltaproteobacteria bacterium]